MNTVLRISLVLFYIYTVYEYIMRVYFEKEMSEVLKIGDIIAVTAAVTCVFFKWLYYYIKRRRVVEIIFKVLLQQTNSNLSFHFKNFRL